MPIATPDGVFTARFTDRGLAGLEFPGRTSPGDASPPEPAPGVWVRLTADALHCALAGRAPARLPPLDWQGSTPFQQRIWRALLQIPAGVIRTYGELAAAAGHRRAARAAGSACGANPIPVLVPCHRVVPATGGWGGFSGGTGWKERLLRREGQGHE